MVDISASIKSRIPEMKRKNKLAEVTRNLIGKERVSVSVGPYIRVYRYGKTFGEPVIGVMTAENRIMVENAHYLPRAQQLQEAYEEATGEEFTIKRNYFESQGSFWKKSLN